MPPSLRAAARLAHESASKQFICPSCLVRSFLIPSSSLRPSRRPGQIRRPLRRHVSTIASATAINAPIDVPPAFIGLYEALNKLKTDAPIYVNLSRLQLAQRGLESNNPVTRVGILSAGSPLLARKLAKLLAADPLFQPDDWEKSLEDETVNTGKAILIRYADAQTPPPPPNPILQTILTKSPFLRANNLELLLTTISLQTSTLPSPSSASVSTETFLVPTLQAPNSAAGHPTTIRLPVHKTLLILPTPSSLITLGRFTSSSISSTQALTQSDPESTSVPLPALLKPAVALPTHRVAEPQTGAAPILAIDLELASSALARFRRSVEFGVEFERGWLASGAAAAAEWVSADCRPVADAKLKLPVARLVRDLLCGVEAGLREARRAADAERAARGPAPETRAELRRAVDRWAEQAHAELQVGLAEAVAGSDWRQLAWWALAWRADDVAAVATDVLARRWLVDSEAAFAFLAGRAAQAGAPLLVAAAPPAATAAPAPPHPDDAADHPWPPLPTLRVEDLYTPAERARLLGTSSPSHAADTDSSALPYPAATAPHPATIAAARARLSRATVPPLQARAQALVVRAAGSTALAGALAALAFVGLPGVGVYEAGAVLALGLVWSARRLQRGWEGARRDWVARVREEGRVALRALEGEVREALAEGARTDGFEGGDVQREEWERVEEAVERVRSELDKVS